MPLIKSWVESANRPGTDFPLNNLPCGVFSPGAEEPRCGVAIGDQIFDVCRAEAAGLVALCDTPLFAVPFWNDLMEQGPAVWAALRARLISLLEDGSPARADVEPLLVPMEEAQLHLPFVVSEYTDFYAGQHHAFNVGCMFRGPENALPPNWLHMPIGYNGRASSVYVSGTPVRRPWGQLKSKDHDTPAFLPSRRFDFELELGAVVGTPSEGPIGVRQADAHIFGYVLLNDWSARDVQAWEYQPLGPFQGKATATSISPWIVTKAALDPFRADTPPREVPLLPHLQDVGPMLYDIDLSVALAPAGKAATILSRTNYREMYYSAAQQLAHHTTAGSPMHAGDLLGSGTISGATRHERGSMLELSWGGEDPLELDTGEVRRFLEDGDMVCLSGSAKGDGYVVGFGSCEGTILPALEDPFAP
ncbi:MAG: fumarylacetoacetase [Pseudomonadota bacterium]